MRKSKGTFTAVVLFLIVLVVAVSVIGELVLLPDANPPGRHDGWIVSERTEPILDRACFDCHTNQTEWHWYSYIPPVSLLVALDVAEGREHLNFSDWSSLPPDKQAKEMKHSLKEIREGEMPLPLYLWTHPEAALSEADLAMLTEDIAARYGAAAVDTAIEDEGEEE